MNITCHWHKFLQDNQFTLIESGIFCHSISWQFSCYWGYSQLNNIQCLRLIWICVKWSLVELSCQIYPYVFRECGPSIMYIIFCFLLYFVITLQSVSSADVCIYISELYIIYNKKKLYNSYCWKLIPISYIVCILMMWLKCMMKCRL